MSENGALLASYSGLRQQKSHRIRLPKEFNFFYKHRETLPMIMIIIIIIFLVIITITREQGKHVSLYQTTPPPTHSPSIIRSLTSSTHLTSNCIPFVLVASFTLSIVFCQQLTAVRSKGAEVCDLYHPLIPQIVTKLQIVPTCH